MSDRKPYTAPALVSSTPFVHDSVCDCAACLAEALEGIEMIPQFVAEQCEAIGSLPKCDDPRCKYRALFRVTHRATPDGSERTDNLCAPCLDRVQTLAYEAQVTLINPGE